MDEQRKQVACICGPMNQPGYVERFAAAEKDLTEQGFSVLNPSILPPELTRAAAMRICVAMIDAADVVLFLRDWQKSQGAMAEYTHCQYTGKQMVFQAIQKGGEL